MTMPYCGKPWSRSFEAEDGMEIVGQGADGQETVELVEGVVASMWW